MVRTMPLLRWNTLQYLRAFRFAYSMQLTPNGLSLVLVTQYNKRIPVYANADMLHNRGNEEAASGILIYSRKSIMGAILQGVWC